MTKVDYKTLKSIIVKSCFKTGNYTNDFRIDLEKLNTSLEEQKLIALPVGLNAEQVKPEDMYAVAEYFTGENLRWFDSAKYLTTIICVDATDVDYEVQSRIDKLYFSRQDDPSVDHIKIIADILSTLHCYYVMIVSYNSNDPGRAGKNTYYINCRANKVVLKDPNYVYNPKDIA